MQQFVRLTRLAAAARASAEVAEDDRAARDAEIERLDVEDAARVADIARAARLDPGHVSRILGRRTAARQARTTD